MASNSTLAAVAAASLALGAAGGSQLEEPAPEAPQIAAQQLMLNNLTECQAERDQLRAAGKAALQGEAPKPEVFDALAGK